MSPAYRLLDDTMSASSTILNDRTPNNDVECRTAKDFFPEMLVLIELTVYSHHLEMFLFQAIQ